MLLLAFFLACAPVDGPGPTDASNADLSPTWHQDVAPLVVESCGGCHTAGGIAPFALDSYETAAPMAAAIAEAAASGKMPPWGAQTTEECEPRLGWENDARLSAEQKALLAAWVDAGAPEGDPADAADIPERSQPALAQTDIEVIPDTEYVTSGEKDRIVCRTLDPELTEDGWVTGIEVVPDNLAVVHHVVVFTDPHGESLAKADENGMYDCFSTADVSDELALAVWVPGAFPTLPPDGSGFPITAGTQLVLQMHYHPAGTAGAADRTGVRLDLTTDKPEKTAYLTGVGNAYSGPTGLLADPDDRTFRPEFRVPADNPEHTEWMDVDFADVKARYDVWSMEAHMHMVGVDLLATVEHRDPKVGIEEECLIHEPSWSFDWQRMYSYDGQGITLGTDDLIHLRCTYDNTTGNPGVVRALDDAGLTEPRDVFMGESSYDEMCIIIFGITY